MDIVLLDANVVIWLYSQNRFESILKNYKILITKNIADESSYYDDESGQRNYIDLDKFIKENKLEIIADAPLDEISNLLKRISPIIEIHYGEASCIQTVIKNSNYKFCSGDENAILTMGYLGLEKQAVSLEQLVGRIKEMPPQYTKKVFDKKIKEGKIKRIQAQQI